MNYPVTTSPQLRAILRALRQARGLSQEQLGQLIGVNQKRVAKIENAPGVTSFDQITRLVAALGGRLVIEAADAPTPSISVRTKTGKASKAAAAAIKRTSANW